MGGVKVVGNLIFESGNEAYDLGMSANNPGLLLPDVMSKVASLGPSALAAVHKFLLRLELAQLTEEIQDGADHVHLLVGLKATHCLADFMRELKKASSVWVHEEIKLREFAWQEGYGAFTVSPTARPQVQKYIANQAEHHRVKSFREELVEFLKKAGVKYEDR